MPQEKRQEKKTVKKAYPLIFFVASLEKKNETKHEESILIALGAKRHDTHKRSLYTALLANIFTLNREGARSGHVR